MTNCRSHLFIEPRTCYVFSHFLGYPIFFPIIWLNLMFLDIYAEQMFFPDNAVIILVNWSKAVQDRRQVTTINIPALGSTPLSPVNFLSTMFQIVSLN